MRLAAVIFAGLVILSAVPARAELCSQCTGRSYTKDIGQCTQCDGRTMSGQFKLCHKCSARLQQCHHCLATLNVAATQPAASQPIDGSADGEYSSGHWQYRFKVTAKGTRSEGSTGELLYEGKPVPAATNINDFYQTPWGPMYWVGKRPVPWGPHGWMTRPWVGNKVGSRLAEPTSAQDAAGLALWVRVIQVDRQPAANQPALDDWIAAELKKLKVSGGVGGEWKQLGGEFLVIEDSRHFGQLKVRLGASEDSQVLVVDFGGTGAGVQLPRQAGETKLVHTPLESSVARLDLYLAFKVAKTSPTPTAN